METQQKDEIRRKNDEFRSGCHYMLTRGVIALGDPLCLIAAVSRYNAFTEDNDPYGEHDFGDLEWCGNKILWKIDYYDQNLEFGEEPLSENCRRILTVMLANEY